MNVKMFIDRPILSFVISVGIVFVGIIALMMLPIEQFPEIAPPSIKVSTNYTGASAETVQKSVIVPLEEAINGVEDMLYMTSTASSTGSATITVYFRQGTDADMATVNVQNRIASAQGLLPAEVTRSGVIVRKSQPSNLKIIALYSTDGRFDDKFIANYMMINIEPRISRVSGVGEVTVLGAGYALRIWMDPLKMKQYGLMPSDITAVLNEQNVEFPTGTLGADSDNTFQLDLRYKGRYDSNLDFENIVIRSLSEGEVLYLKDVATVELGSSSYNFISTLDGSEGLTTMIAQTSGSNANDVIIGINAETAEIVKDLPEGLAMLDLMNTKDFLDASIISVLKTLVEAILLVVLIVYVFLQNLRSTIIPSVSIVVSLIGTFAFIYAIGFSLNLLTLFALILVIGTVVDDAIVVVEAVQTKLDGGEKSPYTATVDAMGGITKALVTTTIVFMAVFIPVSFMDGTTGTFYSQFGITMAVAVAISTLNALTLSPALCALIMKPHAMAKDGEKQSFSTRFHIAFDAGFGKFVEKYQAYVVFFLQKKWLAISIIVVTCVGLVYMMSTTKTALVPNEDMGTVFVNVQTSPGYSLSETTKVMEEVEKSIDKIDEIKAYSRIVGFSMLGASGATGGMFIIKLNDWSERTESEQSVDGVVRQIYSLTADITDAQIMAFAPPMISGYGVSNGFELHIQDRKGGNIEDLSTYTSNFINELNTRPEVAHAQTSFNTKSPQYLIEVDAALCKRNGVSPSTVLSTISGYVGGNYASNMNKFSKLYRVIIQASVDNRLDLESLENMYVRSSNGEMSPVSQYVKTEKVYGSQSLSRFNLFPSISINGMPADGYSTGQAITAISEVAEQTLPVGYSYEFGGMTREETSTGNTTAFVFAICIIFVYLILCALYESIFIPLAVLLAIPFGLAGSFLFANMFGLTNNIYMQTGLIMLIGLLAKTAILLTEYASERRSEGMSIVDSALTAAKVRLRPILMTSLTLVFGMLPLVFATGVGANGNISLGVGVVGGMIVGTLALVLIVPVLFVIFQNIQERVMPARKLPKTNMKNIMIVAFLGYILTGCNIYTKYERSAEVEEIDSLYQFIESTNDTTNISALPWKELFTDPILQSLIEQGLKSNTSLNIARLNVEQAQISLKTARLAYLPSVNAVPQGNLTNFNNSTSQTYNLSVSASWEIDIFGKLRNAKERNKSALEHSMAYRQVIQTQLISTIANTYYSLLMLDQQLALSKRTKTNWEENLRTVMALKRVGKMNQISVYQSEANKIALSGHIATIEKQIKELENSLSALIAINPQHIERGSMSQISFPEELSVGVPIQLLSNRPDIRVAEHNLAEMFYATNEARSSFYPSITLGGSVGFSNTLGAIINPGSMIYSAVASIVQPIFNRGVTRAQVKISESKQEQALLQFKQAILDAGVEVNTALIQWQTARERLDYDTSQIDVLEKAVSGSELLMKHGSASYLEVLTAQLSLLQAELTYSTNKFDEIQGVISLYRALGGGDKS